MKRHILIAAAVLAATTSLALATSPEIATQRSRLELDQPPKQAVSVDPLLKQLKAIPAIDNRRELGDVTLVGQIGGMPNPWKNTHPDFPWFKGQASFFVLDAKLAEKFAHHAAHHGGSHDCAFCQNLAAKSANSVAVVNLVDENGKPLKIDSRDLLALEEGQKVTVHGRAELLGGQMLIVHADGIHVER